jgi:hypothetical protein
MSAIWIEQLRYLTTDRWYAKNLIKQNKLLTNFNKFSYWLGWIKINTFKQINADLKELDLDFYNKNFQQYDEIVKIDWTYLDSDIQKILEDNYLWILYSAWLLYAIQKKREVAWYSINDKPWIIITLYNFWNEKKPHSNPEVWGSSIRLNDEYTYYFWELWFLMYYYIKWYL